MPIVVLGVSRALTPHALGPQPDRFAPDCRRRIAVQRQEFGVREYRRAGFVRGPFRGACAALSTQPVAGYAHRCQQLLTIDFTT
jgi:hypothetical protein